MAVAPIRPFCSCCSNTGQVLAADDTPRPCSRCQFEAFNRWANARRPVGSLFQRTFERTPNG